MSLSEKARSLGLQALGHASTLVSIRRLSPSVVRLQLQAPRCATTPFETGCKIKIHIGEGELRSYTPARVDPGRGEMDVIVFVQGESAASAWVSGLSPGHAVSFLGPAKSMPGPTGDEPWAAFYGDETAIGLAQAIRAALPPEVPLFGAIELRPNDLAALDHLALTALARGEDVGAGLVAHAQTLVLPEGPGVVWLSGEASSVLALRTAWLARGVPRERLRIKPYWSLRGKAHRKQLERTLL